MVYTFGQINDATGFANGDQFTSEAQVREYFTVENMRLMFSGECPQTQDDLDAMADAVVENRWHMVEASRRGVIGKVGTPRGAMDTQPRPWTDEGYWNVAAVGVRGRADHRAVRPRFGGRGPNADGRQRPRPGHLQP
jgi:hypothetical protein